MGLLMMITLIGITVAGLATILAIWMERDPRRPAKFAWALSVLILLATGVMILQSILDAKEAAEKEAQYEADQEKLEGDMARMLQKLDSLASDSDDPEVVALLSAELEAQARTNPNVVQKLAQRYADDGEDPTEKLGKHLKGSDMEKLKKSGKLKIDKDKKKKKKKKKKKDKDKKKKKDRDKKKKDREGDEKMSPEAALKALGLDPEDMQEIEKTKKKKKKDKDKKDKKDKKKKDKKKKDKKKAKKKAKKAKKALGF